MLCIYHYQIFGDDIKDASMNEDLLMVIHSNKTFRFYSLKWIIENCTIIDPRLGSEVEGPNGRGIVGDPDFGVPITVKFTGRHNICAVVPISCTGT